MYDKVVRQFSTGTALLGVNPLFHVDHAGSVFHTISNIRGLHCDCPDGRDKRNLLYVS
jgi:hypothetical protein